MEALLMALVLDALWFGPITWAKSLDAPKPAGLSTPATTETKSEPENVA
jgi:hypothetical protein